MTRNPPVDVAQFGQSVWYDNISRDLIQNGELQRLIDEFGVVGVTSNPTIYERAIGHGSAYDAAIRTVLDLEPNQIFDQLAIDDIQRGADLLRPIYDRTKNLDGYISLEVSPVFADDTATTISEAKRLFAAVDRPNLMIKIPGTPAGLRAIEEVLAAGINVNVTLLFSLDSYVKVMERHIAGLERRLAAGQPVSNVSSVASFFVSRIDTVVDRQLDAINTPESRALLGKVAIANAKVAYEAYKATYHGERFAKLRAAGARVQRPLWASTGTKNPAYADTIYVDALIGPETVDTVPPATLTAFKDHGTAAATLEAGLADAKATLGKLPALGISLDAVTSQLQDEGVASFLDSFKKLIEGVSGKVRSLKARRP